MKRPGFPTTEIKIDHNTLRELQRTCRGGHWLPEDLKRHRRVCWRQCARHVRKGPRKWTRFIHASNLTKRVIKILPWIPYSVTVDVDERFARVVTFIAIGIEVWLRWIVLTVVIGV